MNNLELKTDKLQLLLKRYWPEITFPTNPNYLCKAFRSSEEAVSKRLSGSLSRRL